MLGSGEEESTSIYDVALKPKLLRCLLKDCVPHEKHDFADPSVLSDVVSAVKTHKLLSEWAAHDADQQAVDTWRSAVDSWINRLLILVSTNDTKKCWAGICLLGVTCQECSPGRFLASYITWLDKLRAHIQQSVNSLLLKAASAAISDLFMRLSQFPDVKRDGTSHATKIIQQVLNLLNEDTSGVVAEEAVDLLSSMISLFPYSTKRHYDSVEAAIVSKLMSGKCSATVLKKLSYSLSLLPVPQKDEDRWSSMIEKILESINSQLTVFLRGLEEDARGKQQSGRETLLPLGDSTVSEGTSDFTTRRPERLLAARISTLMDCCCMMLTNTYPVQVAVPTGELLALVRRVLVVNGSSTQSSYHFMSTMKQDLICLELPLLHMHSLEILTALIMGLRSLLLPHVADIIKLLEDYFRQCTLSEIRTKVYLILKVLLTSLGVGIAMHLSPVVIENAFIDLDFFAYEKEVTRSNETFVEEFQQFRQKKRKYSSTRLALKQPDHDSSKVGTGQNRIPVSLKIAALETLEALLTVGGSLRSESWRSNVDALLITVATNACKDGWLKEEIGFVSCQRASDLAGFQLTALRALLASLLSPGRVSPRHLPMALELFHRGKLETGTKLAEFCVHALLTLEVLMHPRSLLLADHGSTMDSYAGRLLKSRNSLYPSEHRQNSGFHDGMQGKGLGEYGTEDDDLYEKWRGNDDEIVVEVVNKQKVPDPTDASSPNPGGSSLHGLPSADGNFVKTAHEESKLVPSASIPREENALSRNNTISESLPLGITSGLPREDASGTTSGSANPKSHDTVVENAGLNPTGSKIDDVAAPSDVTSSLREQKASTSGDDVTGTVVEGYNTILDSISATLAKFSEHKDLMHESDIKDLMHKFDNEVSMDMIPDIVDGDPDSD